MSINEKRPETRRLDRVQDLGERAVSAARPWSKLVLGALGFGVVGRLVITFVSHPVSDTSLASFGGLAVSLLGAWAAFRRTGDPRDPP